MDNWRRFRLGGSGNNGSGSGSGNGVPSKDSPNALNADGGSTALDEKSKDPSLADDFLWGLENVSKKD